MKKLLPLSILYTTITACAQVHTPSENPVGTTKIIETTIYKAEASFDTIKCGQPTVWGEWFPLAASLPYKDDVVGPYIKAYYNSKNELLRVEQGHWNNDKLILYKSKEWVRDTAVRILQKTTRDIIYGDNSGTIERYIYSDLFKNMAQEIQTLDLQGNLLSKIIADIDTTGKIVRETTYNPNGKISEQTYSHHAEDTYGIQCIDSTGIAISRFNKANNPIYASKIQGNALLQWGNKTEHFYQYDSRNRLILDSCKFSEDKTDYLSKHYSYDECENLILVNNIRGDCPLLATSTTRFEYKYNNRRDPIQITVYELDKPTQIIYQKIQYLE